MDADRYTEYSVMWEGGHVSIPAGTPFEYKFIQWGLNGNLTWECGVNRAYTLPGPQCDPVVVNQYGGYFRDGDYQACDRLT